jgi:type III pantothenate kinase
MVKKAKSAAKTVCVCVDVGNSHTVVGIFRGDKIVEHWRLTTRSAATSDEVFLRISGLVVRSKVKTREVTHIGLSTVVPMLERTWIKALDFLFHKPVHVVSDRNCLGLQISYPNPALLGPDRICNTLAMKEMGLSDGIVVDMGTATSFDVMKDGKFLGGVIIPGINASLEVLTQKTARLMPVSLEWPDSIIGDTTEKALRSGLLFGFTGQLEFLIKGIHQELKLKKKVPIMATGGWSELLMQRTKVIDVYDPYLTLKGVRQVALFGNGGSL